MSEINQSPPPGKFLLDPYEDWAKAEGVPIHAGMSVDLLQVDVRPWARFGVNGAFCHLNGRDDFLAVFLIELPPNSGSAPHQHLYEEVCYVLSGTGSTEFQVERAVSPAFFIASSTFCWSHPNRASTEEISPMAARRRYDAAVSEGRR